MGCRQILIAVAGQIRTYPKALPYVLPLTGISFYKAAPRQLIRSHVLMRTSVVHTADLPQSNTATIDAGLADVPGHTSLTILVCALARVICIFGEPRSFQGCSAMIPLTSTTPSGLINYVAEKTSI